MNKIKKFFITKQKEKEYKKYLHDHKINILKAFYEILNCKELNNIFNKNPELVSSLWYRALEHDDSKYEKEEFNAYRKHYFPINIQEKRFNELAFEKAKNHHYQNNDHHWQNRQNWKNENELSLNTKLACLENILDWLARGYEFNNRPYQYYEKVYNKIKLPIEQKKFIEYLIYECIDKERK